MLRRTPMAILSLACLGLPLSCSRGTGTNRGAVAGERTQPSAAYHVSATGIVGGLREADVCAKMPGRITRLDYDEGETVDAGTPVAHLEDRHLKAKLKQARAAMVEACNTLVRVRTLADQGIVAPSELDHAKARCASRRAEAEQAAVWLDYATVKAPFAGTLVRKFKEVGEAVSGNTPPDPIFRLADLSALKVTAEVPESDIALVEPGQAAIVTADAYAGETFSAKVTKVALAVGRKKLRSDDPRERLDEKVVEVELALPPAAPLRSGATVDVTIFATAPDRERAGTDTRARPGNRSLSDGSQMFLKPPEDLTARAPLRPGRSHFASTVRPLL